MKFVDTNVLVYYVDRRDPAKREKARSIVVEAVRNGGFAITYQSLNEFANVALKKLQMTSAEVAVFLRMFKRMTLVAPQLSWTERAMSVRDRYDLQLYDSLLLVAAEDAGCDEFLSEDLNEGQLYCGIRAVNPFK